MKAVDESTLTPLIASLYSVETFQKAAEVWTNALTSHLHKVMNGRGPVLNWRDPNWLIEQAEGWLKRPACADVSSESVAQSLSAVVDQILASGQNLLHPHYIGHQVPAALPLAGLFDGLTAITNQVMAIFEMGPWATAVEHAVVRRMCTAVGWTADESSGLLTHGGSLANLTALLTARNVGIPDSWSHGLPSKTVLLTNSDAHYSVTRSAGILGLGAKQVVRIPVDSRRRIQVDALDAMLRQCREQGQQVMAVSACACATPTGAIDDLSAVAEVCRRHDVWMHVDAAHGGALLLSRQYRDRLRGLEQADSVVWDAHKMMFVPALCAAVLYRNREHRFSTFQQDAPYLFDPSAPGMADIDSGMRTIECTKRAMGYGLWSMWSLFGDTLFEQLVDRVMDQTQRLRELLLAQPDFEVLNDPDCNILVFRYLPKIIREQDAQKQNEFQRTLRTRLIRSGDFYIVQTSLDGVVALRVTLMNPLTTQSDFDELLVAIRHTGNEVLAGE